MDVSPRPFAGSITLQRVAVVAALMLVAIFVPVTDAMAAVPCRNPVDPNISVSPAQGPPGTVLTVSGRAPAGNRVLVDGLGPRAELASVPESGTYAVTVTVPDGTAPGCNELQVTSAPPSGGAGSFGFARFTVTAGPPPPGDGPPPPPSNDPSPPGPGSSAADLAPTAILFDDATYLPGTQVRFDSGIVNRGGIGTGVFNIKWFVDGREVGAYGSHSGIPAGTEVLDGNSQFAWTFDRPGTYTVTFTVDADGFVAESDEGNNSASVTVEIYGASCPDATLRIAGAPGPIGTTFAIEGSGWLPGGVVSVRLPHGSPGIFHIDVPDANVTVRADGTWTLSETVGEPTPPGTYVFTATQDVEQCPGGRLEREVSYEVTASPLTYYALGDSYSSGEGAPEFDAFTSQGNPVNRCHRSTRYAYPVVFAASTGADLGTASLTGLDSPPRFLACSGATTDNIIDTNVIDGTANSGEPLGQATVAGLATADLVTLSVGGNDMGFGRILRSCVTNLVTPCHEEFADFVASRLEEVPRELVDAYEAVADSAPNARVIVLTYPQIFSNDQPDCGGTTGVSPDEITWIRESTTALNDIIELRASEMGFDVLQIENLFGGREICSTEPWANGTDFQDEVLTFHPNAAGYDAIAKRLARCVALAASCAGDIIA